MFGRRITILRLFGFPIRVDPSWLFIAALVTWSLAGSFQVAQPQISPGVRWAMALCGMLGLFVSIVLHELSHALVARAHGVETRGITLFLFGGVAELQREPPSARAEFAIAAVGPLSSIGLAAAFFALARAGIGAAWPLPVVEVLRYLALINFALAVFNLVPGFPLDGGRVLRAILWGWRGSLGWATRIAATAGSLFGLGLVALGIVIALRGNVVGGIWYLLIGLFLRQASQASYTQLQARRALEGERVQRFMRPDPITVPPDATIRRVVDEYFYRDLHRIYPVVDHDQRLLGCVTARRIRDVPRDEWEQRRVGDIVDPCSADNTVHPQSDALEALGRMTKSGASRLMVVEEGRLLGVLTLKDLLQFFSLKLDLEGRASA
jgi:Zn-dependent protease/CBS domain-containing protein